MEAITVNPNDHVNMAQCTNDTIPTAIRLGALWRLDELLAALKNLQTALEQKAHECDEVRQIWRTHLQDAVPVRLGQEFAAYAKAVRTRLENDPAGRRKVCGGLGIGGTAVGYRLERPSRISRPHGEEVEPNLRAYSCTNPTTCLSRCSPWRTRCFSPASLRTSGIDLIRIANDFRLLASGPSTGLAEITCPPFSRVRRSCRAR